MPISDEELEAIVKGITGAVMGAVKKQIGPLLERVKVLEARPAVAYKGVWLDTQKYTAGDFVTFQGSMWCSKLHQNGAQPGNPVAWTLCVKKGRDGKDAA